MTNKFQSSNPIQNIYKLPINHEQRDSNDRRNLWDFPHVAKPAKENELGRAGCSGFVGLQRPTEQLVPIHSDTKEKARQGKPLPGGPLLRQSSRVLELVSKRELHHARVGYQPAVVSEAA